MRELRDRERDLERTQEAPYFHDESVTSRGFGIRTGPTVPPVDDRRDRRRELRREEPRTRSDEDITRDPEPDHDRRRRGRVDDVEEHRRRSDEDLPRESDLDRERRRRGRADDRDEPRRRSDEELLQEPDPDREARRRSRFDDREEPREGRETYRGSDEERSRLRDKVASGVGIAAAALGLAPAFKDDDGRDGSDKEPRRRRSPTTDRDPREEADGDHSRADERDRFADRSKDRDYERDRYESRDEADRKERRRPEAEEKLDGGAIASGSDSDGGKKVSRRNRPSIGFNPNDASDISSLREQLAAMNTSDKEMEPAVRESSSKEPAIVEKRPSPSQSPPFRDRRVSDDEERDESRGREMALVRPEEKMVRVVSPPREKKEDKPLRGILKNPRVRFPEEEAYVREGVAPHKEDKKAKEVPAGAKWTKIWRKVVNPEALTIGGERFEVRDDFVIVLRVLSREEIEAYAEATKVLRRESCPIRPLSCMYLED